MELRQWIIDEHASLQARFDRAIVENVPRRQWRDQAGNGGSSIAFLVLHTAWHADLAVQTAVRGEEPVLNQWRDALGLGRRPPATALGEAEDPDVTAALDLEALTAYAAEVHDATGRWLSAVDLESFADCPPASERIAGVAAITEGDVPWLHAMWTDKPVGWFAQWEAIGHRLNHLGEMMSVRSRLGLSPF
jgi:hypothetical protein